MSFAVRIGTLVMVVMATVSILIAVLWSRHLASPTGAIAVQLVGCAAAMLVVWTGVLRLVDPQLPIAIRSYRTERTWTHAGAERQLHTKIPTGERRFRLSRFTASLVVAVGLAIAVGAFVSSIPLGRRVDLSADERSALYDALRASNGKRSLAACLPEPTYAICIGTYHVAADGDRAVVRVVKPNACRRNSVEPVLPDGVRSCLEAQLAAAPALELSETLRDRLGPVGLDIEIWTHINTEAEK